MFEKDNLTNYFGKCFVIDNLNIRLDPFQTEEFWFSIQKVNININRNTKFFVELEDRNKHKYRQKDNWNENTKNGSV